MIWSPERIAKEADKAIAEGITKEMLEVLFQPRGVSGLLARYCGLDQFEKLVQKAATSIHPETMLHRFLDPYVQKSCALISREKVYRAIKLRLSSESHTDLRKNDDH